MEGAGRLVTDEDLRAAMAGKGLGTSATRASIIEGLIGEDYIIREGKELQATPKAFMLMELLNGLGRPGAHPPRAHRELGVPALPDAGRKEEPRRVHGGDRPDDPADRGPGAPVRARHHPGRLRLPLRTVPQVPGRGARAIPELSVQELRLDSAQDPGRTAAERRRDRHAHRTRPDRAPARVPEPPGPALCRGADAVARIQDSFRFRQRLP